LYKLQLLIITMEAITDVDLAYAEFERLIKQVDTGGVLQRHAMSLCEKQDIYNGPSADYILRIRRTIELRETWDHLPGLIQNPDVMGLLMRIIHPHSVRAFTVACNGGPCHVLNFVPEGSWPAWVHYIVDDQSESD
jgi:hypothetical protein